MKLFQPQISCMHGHTICVDHSNGMPSLIYPNAEGYCYHDFIEIELFTCGCGIHHLNTIPYRVKGGYFYLLMPGDFHYYSLDESEPFELYNIKIDAAYPQSEILEKLSAFPRPYAVYLEGEEYQAVLREVQLLYNYWNERNTRGKDPVDAMTRNIAERIILLLSANLKLPERTVTASFPSELRHILDYVDQHYTDTITAEDMAALTALTPHYFSEYFKKQCGICFCDYVNQVRLFRAMNLLNTTDLSIKEIAAAVGFHSQAYFTRLFTRQFALSPRAYRQKNSNDRSHAIF